MGGLLAVTESGGTYYPTYVLISKLTSHCVTNLRLYGLGGDFHAFIDFWCEVCSSFGFLLDYKEWV